MHYSCGPDVVLAEGIEPTTPGVRVRYSDQLSYASIKMVGAVGVEPTTLWLKARNATIASRTRKNGFTKWSRTIVYPLDEDHPYR